MDALTGEQMLLFWFHCNKRSMLQLLTTNDLVGGCVYQ